jgi:hypothetical protein
MGPFFITRIFLAFGRSNMAKERIATLHHVAFIQALDYIQLDSKLLLLMGVVQNAP